LAAGTITVYNAPWSIASGTAFTIEGQNLDRVTDVQAMWTTLNANGQFSRWAQSVAIESQTPETLTLQAPMTTTSLRIDLALRKSISGSVTQGLLFSLELTP
jgi:hypothetical protein